MKTLALILTLSSLAWACPKNSVEYNGNCFVDIKPEGTKDSVQASDEKPSHHPEPAWQRGEAVVVDAPSTLAQDEKEDEDRRKATAEGQINCEKKFGKGNCGPNTGKKPETHTFTLKGEGK